MKILSVGLVSAKRSKGNDPSGMKVFLVETDTPVTDLIDPILEAVAPGADGQDVGVSIPTYDDLWDTNTSDGLRVTVKGAAPADGDGGTQEGYFWFVEVSYAVTNISAGQNDEDPTDREWLWEKTSEKSEEVVVHSLFTTTGFIYPETVAGKMVTLTKGMAITNTAGEPPENGVTGPVSNRIITLTKYVNGFADLGVASWSALDDLIDTLNDATVTLLGVAYTKWQLRMDDIDYKPTSQNGFDVIEVNFRLHADIKKDHVFCFPSAGFNQKVGADLKRITNADGDDVQTPRLLDDVGAVLPLPGAAPFIAVPYIVAAGRNELEDWSALTLPAAIP